MTHVPSVPLVVEDIDSKGPSSFVRCVYFTIECEEPSPNWVLSLRGQQIPFLLLGLSGVIYTPAADREEFTSPEEFERVVHDVEANEHLYIGTADVWLPHEVLPWPQTRGGPQTGTVFRLQERVFALAYRYRHNVFTRNKFLAMSRDLRELIRHAPADTEAIGTWITQQIDAAKEAYPKNADLVLKWGAGPGKTRRRRQ